MVMVGACRLGNVREEEKEEKVKGQVKYRSCAHAAMRHVQNLIQIRKDVKVRKMQERWVQGTTYQKSSNTTHGCDVTRSSKNQSVETGWTGKRLRSGSFASRTGQKIEKNTVRVPRRSL